jgi:hypothetical protein
VIFMATALLSVASFVVGPSTAAASVSFSTERTFEWTYRALAATAGTTQSVTATVRGAAGGSQNGGLVLRSSGSGQFVLANFSGTTFQIYLATDDNLELVYQKPFVTSASGVARAQVVGTALRVYWNTTLVTATTLSQLARYSRSGHWPRHLAGAGVSGVAHGCHELFERHLAAADAAQVAVRGSGRRRCQRNLWRLARHADPDRRHLERRLRIADQAVLVGARWRVESLAGASGRRGGRHLQGPGRDVGGRREGSVRPAVARDLDQAQGEPSRPPRHRLHPVRPRVQRVLGALVGARHRGTGVHRLVEAVQGTAEVDPAELEARLLPERRKLARPRTGLAEGLPRARRTST